MLHTSRKVAAYTFHQTHITKHDIKATSVLYTLKRGYSSRNEEIIASICTNCNWKFKVPIDFSQIYHIFKKKLTTMSSPRKNSIRKKMIAQNWGNGSMPKHSGYVMKLNAGPPVATDDTGKPDSSAKWKEYVSAD